jgi:hypothetical protein
MPTILEIEGNLVREVTRTVGAEMRLDQFLPLIETRMPVILPTLPKNSVRAINYNATNPNNVTLALLVEVPPRIINLNMVGDIHRLSIPFSRWIMLFHNSSGDPTNTAWTFDEYYLFWAKQPFTAPDTYDMRPAMLPNIYRDSGSICFGSTGGRADQTIADRIDQIVNEFYATEFNHDLTIRFPNGWSGFGPWESMTENKPLDWANWSDWTRTDLWSLNSRLGQQFDRTTTLVAADPIPEIPIGASFGRTQEWLASLTNSQRVRILRSLQALPAEMLAAE